MLNHAFIATSCLLALLLTSCAAPRGGRAVRALVQHELRVGNVERQYFLYTPTGKHSGPRPLVIVLHGGGGKAKQIARATGRGFHALADRDGAYVVYPDAVDGMWDFGAGKVSRELETRVDDRRYFEALLSDLPRQLEIDRTRVFATGISRGGQASYFLACTFPGRFRAIAAVTMPLPQFMVEICRDVPPVGIAILNGTKDPLVPYEGGEIQVGRRARGRVLSTDESIAFWRERNGCGFDPTSRERINAARDRMHVDRVSWRDCAGAPVVLYRIEGGGHTWPSGSQYLPRFVVGRVNRDIDATKEVWKFFQGFE